SQIHRKNSGVSSLYEDAESTATPDYASTIRSADPRGSIERPRTGVMRTVGNAGAEEERLSIPDIDFGPTLNYASDRIPRQRSPLRKPSPSPAQGYSAGRQPRHQS